MTDQPTQERCPTCHFAERPWYEEKWPNGMVTRTYVDCRDPWHGSQDVEGAFASAIRRPGETPEQYGERVKAYQPTTQEAEKALETIEHALNVNLDLWRDNNEPGDFDRDVIEPTQAALAALRSLRTQHTETLEQVQTYREMWLAADEAVKSLTEEATKDREEIERLRALKFQYLDEKEHWMTKAQEAERQGAMLKAFLHQHPDGEVYGGVYEENGTSRVCWAHREGQMCCIDHLERELARG